MITIPTVLVLGAGASIPYGFPSGEDLRAGINSHLASDLGGWLSMLEKLGIEVNKAKAFQKKLSFCERLSVDAFLEHNSEFLDVGKSAIALALMQYENENNLFNKKSSWYQYLFERLNTSFDRFNENKLSIITFNYDRSIEQYLFIAMKNLYGKSDEECAEKLSKIPIIHVHGRLGALPWQEQGGRAYSSKVIFNEKLQVHGKPYAPKIISPEELSIASGGIKIISENLDTSPDFEKAFQLMIAADRIYFLGFGYNSVNLQRLKIDKLSQLRLSIMRSIMGTSYGLGSSERVTITGKWKINLPNKDTPVDSSSYIWYFLKEYSFLE